MIFEQEKRIQRAVVSQRVRSIQVSIGVPAGVQLRDTLPGPLAQLLDRPKLNGGSWARLGTGRRHVVLLAVVTERALVGVAVLFVAPQHAERTGGDAISAAVADVGLNVHVAEL